MNYEEWDTYRRATWPHEWHEYDITFAREERFVLAWWSPLCDIAWVREPSATSGGGTYGVRV